MLVDAYALPGDGSPAGRNRLFELRQMSNASLQDKSASGSPTIRNHISQMPVSDGRHLRPKTGVKTQRQHIEARMNTSKSFSGRNSRAFVITDKLRITSADRNASQKNSLNIQSLHTKRSTNVSQRGESQINGPYAHINKQAFQLNYRETAGSFTAREVNV